MLPQLPEPIRHPVPSVVRAMVSPSAIVVTAAGAGIGVADHSVILVVVLGAGAWLGRMAVALARARRAGRPPRPPATDPWSVPEPWREYVRQAVSARQRYDQALAQWQAGPLRDRLADLQPRLWQGVEEVWSVARLGATLSGTGRPSQKQLSSELDQVQSEQRRLGPNARDRQAALANREEAIAAQLRAVRRGTDASDEVLDRLRLLTARLDDAVTQLLELGLARSDLSGSDASAAAGAVDVLVGEITSLHEGLRQAGDTLPPGPPITS